MQYAIFGVGDIGEKFLTAYWEQLEISIVFDNKKEGFFYKWEIEKPRYIKNMFVVVTADQYHEIRKQLIELGYSEFSDFVPYQIFNRKMAVAYGNCHMWAVKTYLERDKDFAKDYGFYPLPMIQNMKLLENYELVLPHCELFLHQAIRKENIYGEKYASENMISYLSKQCQVVSIPNLFALPDCFFPQQQKYWKERQFYFNLGEDIWIERWLEEGKTEEEIKAYIVKGGVYQRQEILELWRDFQNKLYKREKEWDVKISDYIMDNYKTIKLFYDKYHISATLAREIASRTMQYMGYEGQIPYELPIYLDSCEMFIYQDVKEALGLQFEESYIRLGQKYCPLNESYMDIDNYVHQTCKWIRRQKYFDNYAVTSSER